MPTSLRSNLEKASGRRLFVLLSIISGCVLIGVILTNLPGAFAPSIPDPIVQTPTIEQPLIGVSATNLQVVWNGGSDAELAFQPTTDASNIRREDYVGPDTCKKCHPEQYSNWSTHPHRWMNALATSRTVKGDFSGTASIVYQGNRGEFIEDGDRRVMRITTPEGLTQVYEIHETIGSRFFQYYIGALVEGDPPDERGEYERDHVLPFGYWLGRDEWVPVVRVQLEHPDEGKRWNPLKPHRGGDVVINMHYAENCSDCHTTRSLGEVMVRKVALIGDHSPVSMKLSAADYLSNEFPDIMAGAMSNESAADQMQAAQAQLRTVAPWRRGITCEACHLGCRAHVEKQRRKPSFLASGDHLAVADTDTSADSGRTKANLNWVCSRCHKGVRPRFAAGMGTWNSTEFSDATRGSCYSQLTCVKCHNPHKGIGQRWTRSLQQDDAVCLNCHQQFVQPEQRLAHTHHAAGSGGDSCVNCHMPKLNEGMQDVVRTHMIYSPTQPDMIEAGHPNACNLCHLDKPIDWTVQNLGDWYGQEFLESHIDRNYPDRDAPVGRVWLTHELEAVRLVATDTASRQNARWALPEIIDQLDDPYLLNRQFALMAVERMLDIKLSDFGYRFYMSQAERREPLNQIRQAMR
uniref:Uncharacterized protein n=1 Tax=uncultured myxobacterium HF0200_08J13 TaxID=723558 RepID=E7C3P9_9BACT|nr:hypothetical protein [uncultured myxobacterium HF0200_08J13]